MKHLFAFAITFLLAAPAFAFEVEYLGASTTEMENPHDIKLSPDGNVLFVSDVGNNRVLRLNAFMTVQQTIGTGNRGNARGELNRPDGIESKGKLLWIADTGNNRILLLRRTD